MRNNLTKIAHILVILFIGAIGVQTIISCSSGGGGGGNSARAGIYSGTAGGSTYSLEIFANNEFEFTWTDSDNSTKTSTGTVQSVSGNVFTMQPYNAQTTFNVTVSDEGLTGMSGTFTWEDGTTSTRSGTLTPSGGPGPVTPPVIGGGSSSSLRSGSSSSVVGGSDIGPCIDREVPIGTQVWQRCNLNVVPSTGNSACYDNDPSNCEKYGRLYDWATAMALPAECNDEESNFLNANCTIGTPHQGICPGGWHIPSYDEWNILIPYDGGSYYTVKKLKSTSGWNSNGTDDYGFAALPGGYGRKNGYFDVGEFGGGYWWSASEVSDYRAEYQYMLDNGATATTIGDKLYLYSVRCLKD